MARLIDADALKEYIDCGHLRNPCEVCFSELDVVNLIDAQPTIDAVPVIRCRDCARNPNNGIARTICPCPMDRYMGDEGFCSKAEPR